MTETFYPSEVVDIDSLIPHKSNYNTHSDAQLGHLSNRLRQFGQFKNIIAWRQYIVAGHGLVQAARARGWKRIEVKRLPAEWNEARVKAVLVADNEIARQSDPDQEMMAALLQEVGQYDKELIEAAGFGQRELEQLLARLEPPIDPAQEWQGMPEFEHDDLTAFQTLHVHFPDSEAVSAFSKLIDQNITNSTKSVWYAKQERIEYGVAHES